MKKLDNGQLKWLLGLYRAVIAAALLGIGAAVWTSVQTTIRLEERVIAINDRLDKSDQRLTRLEDRRHGR